MPSIQSSRPHVLPAEEEEKLLADIDSLSPSMLEAVAAHLSEQLGEAMVVVETAQKSVLSSSRQRTFHLVRARSDESGRDLSLHVRLTPWRFRQRDGNRLDGYLSDRGFPVPKFFGAVRHDGLIATLWEHCPGLSHKRYNKMPRSQRQATIRSIAMISALAAPLRDHVEVPEGPRWIHPVAENIRKSAGSWGDLTPHQSDLDYLAEHENEVIERFLQSGPQVLTHNDLMARNVIDMADGQVRILDWDSATIAPAGASLRGFVYCMKGGIVHESADLYASEMARHGFALRMDDVSFVMRAQQIFWYLSSGFQRKSFVRLAKGLELFRAAHPDL